MQVDEQERIRRAVRQRYAKVAGADSSGQEKNQSISQGCCGSKGVSLSDTGGGCGCGPSGRAVEAASLPASLIGYSVEDLGSVPEGANMGLGCGNPVALASLKAGETVVDLGSGGGFDCFLAAARVGSAGRVVGVDMTAEMVAKARQNAQTTGVSNVEFRLGEIEHLPVADNAADIILSNCVINLSVDKNQVYGDAFRVLKPGGRLAISDIVALMPLPPEIKKDLALYSACVGGAATIDDTRAMLEQAGYQDIRIDIPPEGRRAIETCAPDDEIGKYVSSAYIQAVKPGK